MKAEINLRRGQYRITEVHVDKFLNNTGLLLIIEIRANRISGGKRSVTVSRY